jgi:hypothetical protein
MNRRTFFAACAAVAGGAGTVQSERLQRSTIKPSDITWDNNDDIGAWIRRQYLEEWQKKFEQEFLFGDGCCRVVTIRRQHGDDCGGC